jgi:hypothetical protein
MCEISDFYSRCNSLRDMYGRLLKPERVQDADDQAEIEELRRELREDPYAVRLCSRTRSSLSG